MAAAVHAAPQMGGVMGQHPHIVQHQYDYQNGYSVMEDSDDGHPTDAMDDDMEAYYRQHEYEQHFHQQQMLAQQAGMQYNHEDDQDLDDQDMYSDDSSEESVLPDENIDFGLIYALHTFLATVEGQASVVKGDSLLLLDDANSYWWLVRVLKTEDVGYIPAENVETPYERLARLNKHRNIDVAAATDREKADADAREAKKQDSKLKNLINWRRGSSQPPNPADLYDDDPEQREGRRVDFGPLTYVDHPGVTWSSDEEDDDDEDDEHEGDIEDGDRDVDMDQHIDEQLMYDGEPDDGIEWAQDAVEAMRSASADGTAAIEMQDADMAPTSRVEQDQDSRVASEVAAVAAGTGMLSASNATDDPADARSEVSSPGEQPPGAFPPAPQRSPSPSASPIHGLAARALPTPPPSRAPAMSPAHEASPEPPTREMTPITPPAQSSATVPTVATPVTPASSDMHTAESHSPKGHEPSVSVASAVSAFSTTSGEQTPTDTPVRNSTHSQASSFSTPTALATGAAVAAVAAGIGGAAAAGAAAVATGAAVVTAANTPSSPVGTTPASPASVGPPVLFRSPEGPAKQPTQQPAPTQQAVKAPTASVPAPNSTKPVAPLWYTDAFDISRLSTLIRARATDIKRNTPVPRPRKSAEPADAVQRVLYGDRPEIDHLPLDLRAPFVHLQAKLDAFDREIDDLLGSLVPAP